MFDHPAVVFRCRRCGKEVPQGHEERCWYCMGPLCVDCWDQFGHCGHPEADAINDRMAQAGKPDNPNDV